MKEDIRKQIIEATVECIEEEGVQNVTVRKIAQKAGVNFAAINYYFGTKDNLIKATLDATFEEGFVNNLQDYEELWRKDPRKALNGFFSDTMQGMVEYKEVTRAHFLEAFNRDQDPAISLAKLNNFLTKFFSLLDSNLPESGTLEKKFALIHLISAIFLPGLFPDLFKDFLHSDFSDKKTRERYVKTLVNRIIDQTTISENNRGS